MSLGVICGSVPCLPFLLRRLDLSRLASFFDSLLYTSKARSKEGLILPCHDFKRVGSNTCP